MQRYVIGITLPQAFSEEIEVWRRKFQAPKMQPHITLIPPFTWHESETELDSIITNALGGIRKFPISGEGQGTFGNAVIFVNVTANKHLNNLNRTLANAFEKVGVTQERRRFHPHITLAARLSPDQFQYNKSLLVDYTPQYSFECDEITLFTKVIDNNHKHWEVVKAFTLK